MFFQAGLPPANGGHRAGKLWRLCAGQAAASLQVRRRTISRCWTRFASKAGSLRVWSLTRNKKQLFSWRDTAMRLRSQRPLHVQGDAGHSG
jgi:hypothetical protein